MVAQSLALSETCTVRELVAQYPQTVRVFEQFGIDYCCGGQRDLRTACAESDVSSGLLLVALQRALSAPAPPEPVRRNWSAVTVAELADHIENQHHTYLKSELPRLEDMLGLVEQAHQAMHGQMLRALTVVVNELRREIMQHLLREEHLLFPMIRQVEAYSNGHGIRPQGASLELVVAELEDEHEHVAHVLESIRQLTDNFTLPSDACATFDQLWAGLRCLDADLREHIHLENNVLFPRTLEMVRNCLAC